MKLYLLLLLLIIFSIFSCKEESRKVVQSTKVNNLIVAPQVCTPGKDTFKLPLVIAAGAPVNAKTNVPPTNRSSIINNNASQGTPSFVNYTTNEGLALDAIFCSIIDKTGNLWFGTSGGGVSRYDGKTFTNYSKAQGLSNNGVRCVAEDKEGNLWFGTDGGGVSCFNGRYFTNYTTVDGLPNNVIFSITEDRTGNLWFGTYGGGVSCYNGKLFKNYTKTQGIVNDTIWSIIEDKKGNLWFGTNGGLSRYDGKSFTSYNTEYGLANNAVRCIAEDRKGNLWLGTANGGLIHYDGKSFTNYTTEQGLANNTIWTILEDKGGNLWFGTDEGGVSSYDGKSFINYNTTNGLSNNTIWSITEDKTGNLWFGTSGGGVSRYDGKSFANYTSSHGLASNIIWSITEDKKGDLWFGTFGNGVSRYDGKSFTNYTTAHGLANNVVLSITEDKKGNIWLGTEGYGVSCYDGKSFKNYTTIQGLTNNIVLSIMEDKTGNLWFGTYGGGVSRYDGKFFTNYSIEQGLANNVVFSIAEDKAGNVWFGTDGGGVSRYDGKNFTNYTTAQGLPSDAVWCINEDKEGNIWFGTNGGVSRYDGNSFANFSAIQGLPDDVVTQVIADKNGKSMVIATNLGVAVGLSYTPKLAYKTSKKDLPFQNNLNNEELTKYYDLDLEIYNTTTGYPIKDVNTGQNCLFQDSKGVYWAGTGSDETALVRMDFGKLNRNKETPSPLLYNIKLNEENICYYSLDSKFKIQDSRVGSTNLRQAQNDSTTNAQQEIITYGKLLSQQERDTLRKQFTGIEFDGITKFYPIPQNLVLPYEHNNVTFEFNAVQLSRSHLLNFQYMLEGYDKTWSPILKKREASFGNISEGTYTFKLKAQYTGPDGNNEWSEVITYSFKVLPPWYRTWWMYTIYTLCLISFVFALVWANGKRLRAKAIELQVKVDEATHEIKEQKKVVDEKHKEITDSINYAERIQRSFLATKELLDTNLTEYFVFFKPKDIVSGDFYWASKLYNDQFALVTADSTGHGVPGAIMSLLNITSLEKAVESYIKPSDILNSTRKTIINRLKNDGSIEGGKDGMDASLCIYDFKNKKVGIASANNPVWIVRNSGTAQLEVIEIKPDKMPIGKHDKDATSFTQQEINLLSGDVIYTLTDGFPDQFGGPNGKKFMSKNLRELLAANAHMPMVEQKQLLGKTFADWIGNMEQVDDVCIIAVRV